MPTVQYTQVDYDVNADIEDIAVYDHEVRTTVDLSDMETDVLNAISFDNAYDLLLWANDEKKISFNEVRECLKNNELGTAEESKELKQYSLAELFTEMLRRHVGEAV